MKQAFFIFIVSLCILVGCKPNTGNSNIGSLGVDSSQIRRLAIHNPNKAEQVIDSLLKNSSQTRNSKAFLLMEKGRTYIQQGKYSIAASAFEASLEIYQDLKDEKNVARNNIMLASTNISLKKEELAMEQLLNALHIVKKYSIKKSESHIYNTIAHIHFKNKSYDSAVSFTKRALHIQQDLDDMASIATTYNNLAIIYKNIGQLENALSCTKRSLDIDKGRNDDIGMAKNYNSMGQIYALQSNTRAAKNYYQKAIKINKDNQLLNTTPLRNLADVFFAEGDILKAEDLYRRALQLDQKSKRSDLQEVIYNKLLAISLKKEDFKSAYSYLQKRDSINLHLAEVNNKQQIISVKNQFKLNAKESELRQEISDNNKNRIIFLSLLVGVILLTLFLYQRFRNKELRLQQEKIYLEQTVLRSQMNPHFIFNTLAAIQNSLLDKEPIKVASQLARFAQLIRQNFDFINERTIRLTDEIAALENYVETQQMRFEDKFVFDVELNNINTDEVQIPPMLLQPFIENSIEHGFKNRKSGGFITLKINRHLDKIRFEIIDNGQGYETHTAIDNKQHAIDIFKKRLKLMGQYDELSFKINSTALGTHIQFELSTT